MIMRGRANGYNKLSRIFTIRNKFKNFLSKWKVENHELNNVQLLENIVCHGYMLSRQDITLDYIDRLSWAGAER